jgi:hypothetical protein
MSGTIPSEWIPAQGGTAKYTKKIGAPRCPEMEDQPLEGKAGDPVSTFPLPQA